MKALLYIICCLLGLEAQSNVYVVIYATAQGKTGHAGIAIDNYQIYLTNSGYDTVKTGTLTYYDLWPENDNVPLFSYSKNRTAKYFKLPNHIWKDDITLNSLYDFGVPHREFYPCDALLMLKTCPTSDAALINYLDSICQTAKPFNPRRFNCTDFVSMGLQKVLCSKIRAREFIPLTFCTTPNKLCRVLIKNKEITILKNPGKKINKSFIAQRILKRKKPDTLFIASNH